MSKLYRGLVVAIAILMLSTQIWAEEAGETTEVKLPYTIVVRNLDTLKASMKYFLGLPLVPVETFAADGSVEILSEPLVEGDNYKPTSTYELLNDYVFVPWSRGGDPSRAIGMRLNSLVSEVQTVLSAPLLSQVFLNSANGDVLHSEDKLEIDAAGNELKSVQGMIGFVRNLERLKFKVKQVRPDLWQLDEELFGKRVEDNGNTRIMIGGKKEGLEKAFGENGDIESTYLGEGEDVGITYDGLLNSKKEKLKQYNKFAKEQIEALKLEVGETEEIFELRRAMTEAGLDVGREMLLGIAAARMGLSVGREATEAGAAPGTMTTKGKVTATKDSPLLVSLAQIKNAKRVFSPITYEGPNYGGSAFMPLTDSQKKYFKAFADYMEASNTQVLEKGYFEYIGDAEVIDLGAAAKKQKESYDEGISVVPIKDQAPKDEYAEYEADIDNQEQDAETKKPQEHVKVSLALSKEERALMAVESRIMSAMFRDVSKLGLYEGFVLTTQSEEGFTTVAGQRLPRDSYTKATLSYLAQESEANFDYKIKEADGVILHALSVPEDHAKFFQEIFAGNTKIVFAETELSGEETFWFAMGHDAESALLNTIEAQRADSGRAREKTTPVIKSRIRMTPVIASVYRQLLKMRTIKTPLGDKKESPSAGKFLSRTERESFRKALDYLEVLETYATEGDGEALYYDTLNSEINLSSEDTLSFSLMLDEDALTAFGRLMAYYIDDALK